MADNRSESVSRASVDALVLDLTTSLSNPTARDAVPLVELDYIESQLFRAVIILRGAHNAQAALSALPLEILSIIFEYTHHESLVDEYDFDAASGCMDLAYTLASVCRAWRTAALSLPCLWSVIYLRQAEETRTFLSRAKAHPLHLLASDDEYRSYESVYACASQLRTVAIGGEVNAAQVLPGLLSVDMPILRTLYVRASLSHHFSMTTASVPSRPALKNLTLCNIFLPGIGTGTLTHVTLARLPIGISEPFYDFLNASPNIQHLTFIAVTVPVWMLPQSSLLQLKTLELGDMPDIADSMNLMGTMIMPDTVDFRIWEAPHLRDCFDVDLILREVLDYSAGQIKMLVVPPISLLPRVDCHGWTLVGDVLTLAMLFEIPTIIKGHWAVGITTLWLGHVTQEFPIASWACILELTMPNLQKVVVCHDYDDANSLKGTNTPFAVVIAYAAIKALPQVQFYRPVSASQAMLIVETLLPLCDRPHLTIIPDSLDERWLANEDLFEEYGTSLISVRHGFTEFGGLHLWSTKSSEWYLSDFI